jgi:hypothetical protein
MQPLRHDPIAYISKLAVNRPAKPMADTSKQCLHGGHGGQATALAYTITATLSSAPVLQSPAYDRGLVIP